MMRVALTMIYFSTLLIVSTERFFFLKNWICHLVSLSLRAFIFSQHYPSFQRNNIVFLYKIIVLAHTIDEFFIVNLKRLVAIVCRHT